MMDCLTGVNVVYQTQDLYSINEAQTAAPLTLITEGHEREEERSDDSIEFPEDPAKEETLVSMTCKMIPVGVFQFCGQYRIYIQ